MANFTIGTRFPARTAEHAETLLGLGGEVDRAVLANRGVLVSRPPTEVAEAGFLDAVANGFNEAESVCRVPEVEITTDGRLLLIRADDETLAYPWALEKLGFFCFLTVFGHDRWLAAKYQLPGFVELTSGDVVLDCGSFVGGFSLAAARSGAAAVHAVEPSRANRAALERNVGGHAEIHAVGLGGETVVATFTDSTTGVDSSFAELDEGTQADAYDVQVLRSSEFVGQLQEAATFMKIEAEGLELDILRALDDIRIPRIVVDASPEGGSDDTPQLLAWLELAGYEVFRDRHMLYARHGARA